MLQLRAFPVIQINWHVAFLKSSF